MRYSNGHVYLSSDAANNYDYFQCVHLSIYYSHFPCGMGVFGTAALAIHLVSLSQMGWLSSTVGCHWLPLFSGIELLTQSNVLVNTES